MLTEISPRELLACSILFILTKMERCRLGEFERQLTDVVGVLCIQGDAIDEFYLHRWAPDLRVTDLLERALAAARRDE